MVAHLPVWDLTDIGGTRAALAAMIAAAPPYQPPDSLDITRLNVPGQPGQPDVGVALVRPRDPVGALSALVWIHGGGFVMGTIAALATECALAADLGIAVLAVEYRLSPEHPYPAAIDDCATALNWLVEHADELGIDTRRLGLGGISAGAGIAAALALRIRDSGSISPVLLALEIPVLDDRLETASMRAFLDTPMWTRTNAEHSWAAYLRGLEGDVPAYAAPARATDLSGLPPTFIQACEFDPMRDEDISFALRLLEAGVPTELHVYPGTFHGSAGAVPHAAVSIRMKQHRNAAIARALSSSG